MAGRPSGLFMLAELYWKPRRNSRSRSAAPSSTRPTAAPPPPPPEPRRDKSGGGCAARVPSPNDDFQLGPPSFSESPRGSSL
ncbi:hypothetical protein EYF80_050786 [Liparis tanakae]|uniref:Uncharacterized protein n=1 Tax=Liparis tanakae TaxID=230148 RepID=A0A4Z2FCX6_9TELE|nr:hypothetical protein EYF80_050786 [Liparis tanakae]